jgi:hypothetical protein
MEVVGAHISEVATDNTSYMSAARKLIEKGRPKDFCYGCAAHTLFNLLLKDI